MIKKFIAIPPFPTIVLGVISHAGTYISFLKAIDEMDSVLNLFLGGEALVGL